METTCASNPKAPAVLPPHRVTGTFFNELKHRLLDSSCSLSSVLQSTRLQLRNCADRLVREAQNHELGTANPHRFMPLFLILRHWLNARHLRLRVLRACMGPSQAVTMGGTAVLPKPRNHAKTAQWAKSEGCLPRPIRSSKPFSPANANPLWPKVGLL